MVSLLNLGLSIIAIYFSLSIFSISVCLCHLGGDPCMSNDQAGLKVGLQTTIFNTLNKVSKTVNTTFPSLSFSSFPFDAIIANHGSTLVNRSSSLQIFRHPQKT